MMAISFCLANFNYYFAQLSIWLCYFSALLIISWGYAAHILNITHITRMLSAMVVSSSRRAGVRIPQAEACAWKETAPSVAGLILFAAPYCHAHSRTTQTGVRPYWRRIGFEMHCHSFIVNKGNKEPRAFLQVCFCLRGDQIYI